MKTTRLLSALSLVLLLTANSLFASAGTDPADSRQKLVTYEVNVDFSANFAGTTSHFMIAITDQTGRLVVPAQTYHPGIWTYKFSEAGNMVRGTRVAVMVSYPAGQSGWTIPPVAKTGYFIGGNTYKYTLTPVQGVPPGSSGGK